VPEHARGGCGLGVTGELKAGRDFPSRFGAGDGAAKSSLGIVRLRHPCGGVILGASSLSAEYGSPPSHLSLQLCPGRISNGEW